MKSLVFSKKNLKQNQIHKEPRMDGKITIKKEFILLHSFVSPVFSFVNSNPFSLRISQIIKPIIMAATIPQYHFSHFLIRILLIMFYVMLF
jgi:hypothetical protein